MTNLRKISFGNVFVVPKIRRRESLACAAMPRECGRGGNPDLKARP
jgi:hypothetical protein